MIFCRKGPLSEVPWTPRFCALKKDFSNPDCIDYCSKVNLETLHQILQNIYYKLQITRQAQQKTLRTKGMALTLKMMRNSGLKGGLIRMNILIVFKIRSKKV